MMKTIIVLLVLTLATELPKIQAAPAEDISLASRQLPVDLPLPGAVLAVVGLVLAEVQALLATLLGAAPVAVPIVG